MSDRDISDKPVDQLVALMERLRDPQRGCPWDIEQNFSSLARFTLEEAYEVVDAIERNDMTSLKDELGDLLLQVIFHSRIAEEKMLFDVQAVAQGCINKLLRRHPHLFGSAEVSDSAAQSIVWETIKTEERREKSQDKSIFAGLTLALPAIVRACKLQERAARVGFDWVNIKGIIDKVYEELEEVKCEIYNTEGRNKEILIDNVESEIGDLLFSVINLARVTGIDPETALRRANQKFEHRFRFVEESLHTQGKDPKQSTLDEMQNIWDIAKKEESSRYVSP